MMALLEVRNLSKKFGALIANSDVSFDVEKGSIVGLIGPNGAGKTTLFNCVAGLYKPTSGTITLEGRDITNLPSWKIARLGIARTFQVVRPLREMTVLENILVGPTCATAIPPRHLRRQINAWTSASSLPTCPEGREGSP